MVKTVKAPEHAPAPKYFYEKIGDVEYKLQETRLDVFNDATVWSGNPRLIPYLAGKDIHSEEELEVYLQRTPGYEPLRRSIADVGQLEHIYVWRADSSVKYLVLEGATRVTILRELARKQKGQPDEGRFRAVKAKVLPPEFTEEHRVILLARIHVRGSGVRGWSRYVQAKFIYDHTTERNGQSPLMTVSGMARWMGKSVSWVSRLRDAYEFARQYVEYLDDATDAEMKAVHYFSILEEIIKAAGFGPRLKDNTPEAEALRDDIFKMVSSEVFSEYRDARYIRQFHDDPEKWERLKSLEPGIASQLAGEIRAAAPSTAKGKIQSLYSQIERTLDREPDALDLEDLEELGKCTGLLASRLAGDVGPFRLKLQDFIRSLYNVPLDEIKKVTPEEYQQLTDGLEDLRIRLERHSEWMKKRGGS